MVNFGIQFLTMDKRFPKRFASLVFFFLTLASFAQNSNIQLLGRLTYPGQTLANVWGYAAGGKEYALCGAVNGMSVVDVTVPAAPVQLVQIPNVSNLWKEIGVYRHYAYLTTEGRGGTLQIVDLSKLPDTALAYHTYSGDGPIAGQLLTAHSLYVDTVGKFVYLFGSNLGNGGALVLDISVDPYNPVYAGMYTTDYAHGGYVNRDTLYEANINQGYFSVIDFRNKSNPVLLQTMPTPGAFTHSTWLSVNGKTLFTTDERSGASLASFNITDLQNITLLNTYRSNPGSGSVPHNVLILNDWAVVSWYRDGVVIVDAHRPQNLVQVGNYDTDTAQSGNGLDGAWGVYPYLPSGNILVSNVHEGLFVLKPVYKRACYLEGQISDSLCLQALTGVTVTINGTGVQKLNALDGSYHMGTDTSGSFSVTFSKPGYQSKTFSGVSLTAGQVTSLAVSLYQTGTFSFSGHITDAQNNQALAGAILQLTGPDNVTLFSDANGNVGTCALKAGLYTATVSKWGYVIQCLSSLNLSSSSPSLSIALQPGYYDDFSTNLGWKVSGGSGTPWLLSTPVAAYDSSRLASPGNDVPGSCSGQAYITNNGGGDAWLHDVNNGTTVLTSPMFDLSAYKHPLLLYERWFYNGGYRNGPPNDSMVVSLLEGGKSAVLERLGSHDADMGNWTQKMFSLATYGKSGPGMQVSFSISDFPPDNIVEGALGRFQIVDSLGSGIHPPVLSGNHFQTFPNPFQGSFNVIYDFAGLGGSGEFDLYDTEGRLVFNLPLSQSSGEVSLSPQLPCGLYFLRLKTDSFFSGPEKIVKISR